MATEISSSTGRKPAIVLGVEHPQSYAAIRGLSLAGIPVEAVTQRATRRLRLSRYLKGLNRIGPGDEDLLAFLDGRKHLGGVLFAMTDEYMLFLSKNYERLSAHYTLTTLPWARLKPIVDQRELYVAAKACGLNTPAFFAPRDEGDLKRLVADLDVDNEAFLLKTFFDAGPANLELGRYTVIPGMDRAAIESESLKIFRRNGEFPMIAQVIPGGPEQCFGVTILADTNSQPLFSYVVRRLKLFKSAIGGHPSTQFEVGANTQCEIVEDPEALGAALRLVQALGYVGPITLEFRRDPRNNRLVLVKADPRLVGASSLASAVGLDLASTTYRLFEQIPQPSFPTPNPGTQWVWLSSYLDALIRERSYRPVHRELTKGIVTLRKIRSMAYGDLRDPAPFAMDLLAWFWIRTRSLVRREAVPTA